MARQCSLLLVVVAVMAFGFGVVGASKDVTGGYLSYDCDREPRPSTKGTAFAANLRSVLADLPSAAAPEGFASLQSGSGNGTAFARGLCFGDDGRSPVREEDCHECLTLAVERIWLCDGNRRAAFWNAGCFLAYSDTDAFVPTTADGNHWMNFMSSDAVVYPRFYDVVTLVELARSLVPLAAASSGRMAAAGSARLRANGTARAVAQCSPWNVTAAGCARCLDKAVRDFPEILAAEVEGVRSGAASVHRYDCSLRLEISAPALMGKAARIRKRIRDNLAVVVVCAVAAVVAIVAGAAFLLVKKRNKTRKVAHDISSTPRSTSSQGQSGSKLLPPCQFSLPKHRTPSVRKYLSENE